MQEKKQAVRDDQKQRQADLLVLAEKTPASDSAARDAFIQAVRDDELKKDEEKEMLKGMEDAADAALSKEIPATYRRAKSTNSGG